ncbi:MAG: TonB-dependent receptor plug domain-containing protein, partial [Pseudomonadales bacterium]
SSVTFNASDVKGSGGAGSGVSIATSGKINEKLDLAFNVEQQVQDEIKNPDGTSQRSEREVTNTRLKLGLDLSADDRLELGVIYGEEQADAVSNGFGGLSNDDVSQKKTLLSVDYTGKLQDFNNRLSLSLGRDKVDDNGTQWNLKDNNLAWDIDGALGDNHYLSAGLSYREEVVKRPNRSFDDKFTSNNLFAQDVIDVTDNSALTLGFSYEDHNRYGGAFSPKVYWNTALNDRWTLKLGYSEGRIAPALREGSSDYVVSGGPGRTYQGNDNLKPEENQTLEASLSYHGEAFSSAVTVFNSDVDNLITTRDVGGGVNLYSNVEEAKIRGLESDFSWQLNPVAKLSFNYTYTDAINKDGSANDGNQITDRPEHVANLKYIQNVSAIDASVSLGLKAVSSQFTNDANSEEIAGYTTLDLGLVKPINKNLELRANIINLNDRVVLDESDRAIEAGREFRVAITGRF